jgi:hypothetical protein
VAAQIIAVRSGLVMAFVLLTRNFFSFSNICSIKAIETKKLLYRKITSLFYAFIKHTVYYNRAISDLLLYRINYSYVSTN